MHRQLSVQLLVIHRAATLRVKTIIYVHLNVQKAIVLAATLLFQYMTFNSLLFCFSKTRNLEIVGFKLSLINLFS